MSKLNWAQVKSEYLTDSTTSYAKLAKKHAVAVSTIAVRASRENWAADRTKTLSNVEKKTIEKSAQIQVDTVAEINNQHNEIAKLLIRRGLIALQEKEEDGTPKIKPRSFRDVREALMDGVSLQRKALDLDDKDAYIRAQQITVTLPDWYTQTRDAIAAKNREEELELQKKNIN